jgi:hypothetical protein
LPQDGDAAFAAARTAAAALAGMAEMVPPEAPWMAPRAEEWDATTLHEWLAAHVGPMAARRMLATAIEGVFARNSTPPSLLSVLLWIRCGDPLTPFLAADGRGPERRFDGGAQQATPAQPHGQAAGWVPLTLSDRFYTPTLIRLDNEREAHKSICVAGW